MQVPHRKFSEHQRMMISYTNWVKQKHQEKRGVKYRMHPIPWSCPAFSLEPTSLSFEMLVTLLTTKQTQTPKLGQNMSRLTTINSYLA